MAILPVRVTPRASRPGLGGWREGPGGKRELEVRVAAPPADGAANEAVVSLLAKALGVARSDIEIVSGTSSRHKRIGVAMDDAELARRLGT